MHTDEAVNAYTVGQALAGHGFAYDSRDRHGPALVAFAVPLARWQGARTFADLTESQLRLTAVLAGTTTILLFGFAVEMFGFGACLVAALLFAFAPLPVYYDRYFIHESLFVTVIFGLILTAHRGWKQSSLVQGALCGACAALMLACKETAVLHFAAIAAAFLCVSFRNLRGGTFDIARRKPAILAAAIACLALSALLFLWLGNSHNMRLELPHLTANLFARAAGEGHQKPWWYYFHLLAANSGILVCILAVTGLLYVFRTHDRASHRFLAFYALFLTLIYSLIPYKTPWLALNLWLPLALFAGVAMVALWHTRPTGPIVCAVLGTVIALTTFQDTRQRVFLDPAGETNPYAYAHTSDDLLGLLPELDQIAQEHHLSDPRIAVIAADPWPLPWYLRRFPQTGFWQPGQPFPDADFYITDATATEQYKDNLQNFHADFFGVRPGVLILLWSPLPK
jgi:uncharacterized protein (TIGR03663 family)